MTVWVLVMLDERQTTDVELDPPYNFLMRWKPEDTGAHVAADGILRVYSSPTNASQGG
ncbi:MAG: hypothetical protein SVP26_05985 [Chloroflexota bacterium]|nr:hypothetical protein [Chloroflexota bacterium]